MRITSKSNSLHLSDLARIFFLLFAVGVIAGLIGRILHALAASARILTRATYSLLAIIICTDAAIPVAGAQTADIVYSVGELSSDASAGTSTWQYNYTITNTTSAASALPAIDEFTIYFGLGTYSNLSVVSSPSNWGSLVAQPDPILTSDGFFDAQADDSGLAAGATSTSFSVDFTFADLGTPGAQTFNIVDFNDPSTYANPLQVGLTRLASPVAVPEPEIDSSAALGAITLLLGGLLVIRDRRRGFR
jgi:hypothetical protein